MLLSVNIQVRTVILALAMYGADKRRIPEKVERILKSGGVLDFTDIPARRDLDLEDRNRLYERVRTPEMWDTERYFTELIDLNFKLRRVEELVAARCRELCVGTQACERQARRVGIEGRCGACTTHAGRFGVLG